MSAPKRALAAKPAPVVAAFDGAPLDPEALTAEESLAHGERPYRLAADVSADLASRSAPEE
jgi:hypothetical protein